MSTRTNIILDDEIIEEARKLTHLKTKREVVNHALHELVRNLRRKKLLSLRKQGLWEGDLAAMRSRRA